MPPTHSPAPDWIAPLTDTGNLIAWLVAPIIVALLTWFLTWKISERSASRRAMVQRRRQIVSLMARADSLIEREIVRGGYNTGKRGHQLAVSSEYQDITVQALAMFEWGEEQVALWAAMEFAAAIDAPAYALSLARERTARIDWPALEVGQSDMFDGVTGPALGPMGIPYLKVRYVMLSRWAELKGKGPRYANMIGATSGDRARHYAFPAQSDSISRIELPYIWLLKDYTSWSEKDLLEGHYADPYVDQQGPQG